MITISPIGTVRSTRKEKRDDDWSRVDSHIELVESLPAETLSGLQDFSHLEIVFYFHQVDEKDICLAARHPRGNAEFPIVGIFAQRAKDRPNRLGTTIVRLKSIAGRRIYVAGLDAIDGSPVLDIKPVVREFLPGGAIEQPEWVSVVMKDYWELAV
ncbi:MAG: SAM-dependent methyltransferase [Pseudomonadota bacterium]